jgi:hypothetical protein
MERYDPLILVGLKEAYRWCIRMLADTKLHVSYVL